jgi:hypothetical protein
MWAGLHVLRAEAQGRGLSEEDLRRLLAHAFDAFHDAADGIWSALRNMVSQVGQHASAQPEQAPCGPFVPGVSERMPPAAPPGAPESPEQAELRRLSILLEEQAAYNRACHDEEMRDLLDD